MKRHYPIIFTLIIMLSGINTCVYSVQPVSQLFNWNKLDKYYSANSFLPIIYQNIPDPSRALDTTLAIGAIEGAADVSSTGAAIYQIPIKVPDGTMQMQPQISVNYNSQSGNGIMGYGWGLVATSAITRIGKSYYYDEAVDDLKLNTSDNLMLDGKRLMLTSGSNLTIGSIYAPEVEDYSIVEYTTINSRDAFRVRTRDGLVYEYGINNDSYICTQNSTSALYWLLSKVTDHHGNYMLYHYDTNINTGEFYLSSIEYTGNTSANASPYNRIEFSYNLRDDEIDSYVAGNIIRQKVLLTSIKCTYNGVTINEYKFKYILDHYYSKLSEIEEYGLNRSKYNSTIIDWGDYYGDYSKNASEYFSYLDSNREGIYPSFDDFNADGMADMMTFPTKTNYSSADSAYLYLAYSLYGNVSFSKKCSIPLIKEFQNLIYADLNGDGKLDVIRLHKAGDKNYRFEYFIFDGISFKNTGGFNNSDYRVIVGDFNGDGKMELLTRNANVYDGNATIIATGGIDNWGSEYIYCYPNNNFVVDFNGDGKSDILVMNGSSSWVYTLNDKKFSRLTSFNNTELKNWSFNYFGDFNGDGKTDVLCQNSSKLSQVSLYLSTGRTFVKKQIVNHDIEAKVFVSDCNRDGKDEIIHLDPSTGNTYIRIKVGTFNGADFDNEYYNSTLMKYSDIRETPGAIQSNLSIRDFDGDGRVELMLAAYSNVNLIHTFNDKQRLHVEEIIDGFNKQIGFQYTPMTDNGYYSETNEKVSFPVVKVKIPLYVVNSKTTFAGGCSQSLIYKYKDLYIHRQGKGLLCFKEIKETDYYKKTSIVNSFIYAKSFYFPYITSQATIVNNNTIHLIQKQYRISGKGNKRFTFNPYSTRVDDKLKGTNKLQMITGISQYGDPETISTIYDNKHFELQIISYNNIITPDLRLLGLPTIINTSKSNSHTPMWTEIEETSYDNNYNIIKKIHSINKTHVISEESYTYDIFGNILSHTQKPYSSTNPLVTTSKYSANGKNIIESRDPYDFKTIYTYDNKNRLSQIINHKNQTTTYEYDDMGNIIKSTHPNNIIETKTIAWTKSIPQATYSITQTSTIAPTSVTYYNSFNKKVRIGVTQFNGSMIYKDTYYDRNCMLQKESLPFTGTSASLWNTYTYDEFDRPIKIHYASGKEDLFSYSGLSTTEIKSGIQTTRTADATGKLIKVSNDSGTISYSYLSNGNPDTIRVSNSIFTAFDYDAYGRKTSITDPSTGTITYEYDIYGNKSKETDARGLSINTSFDKFGRILKRITPETTYTYKYDSEQRLASITGTNGTSNTYTYDLYDNILTEKEVGMDNKWLQKKYSYSNGLLSGITYLSQTETIASENYIYANKHLKTVKLGNTTIWDLQAIDVFGHPTKIITGNITRNYFFDSYGFPTGRTANSTSGTTILDSSYSFEPTNGNLKFRNDKTRNLVENFTYDNMNRLTGYNKATVSYNNLGNIISKSDAGRLDYDGYKTKTLTPVSALYSTLSKQQDITYTSFMRPKSITENDYQATFQYNANNQRIKMEIKKGKINYLTRHYLGDIYEIDNKNGVIEEKLYLGGNFYNAYAVYIKKNNIWQLNYIYRDYLGSITHITDNKGALLAEYSYDAWGRLRNPANMSVYTPGTEPELKLSRGYTGHEHLTSFNLVNMNARLYDPLIGRFLSADPYIQLDNLQGFNRYTYGMNNPLCYVDESGEIPWLIPILVGAAIGAGVSAIAYSVATLVTGQSWNPMDFLKSIGIGAVGGAIGGGLGYLGSCGILGSFGNSMGYNLLSQVTNSVATDVIFGNDISLGGIAGIAAGAFAGTFIPNFKAVKGNAIKNGFAEIGYNTLRGASTGFVSGNVEAAMNDDPNAIWQNMIGGAISGASRSIFINIAFGAPYKVDKSYGAEGLYRSGGLASLLYPNAGLTLGVNMYAYTSENEDISENIRYHENYHIQQQKKMGWASFYAKVIYEYIKYGFVASYVTNGTLEYGATQYAAQKAPIRSYRIKY